MGIVCVGLGKEVMCKGLGYMGWRGVEGSQSDTTGTSNKCIIGIQIELIILQNLPAAGCGLLVVKLLGVAAVATFPAAEAVNVSA